MTDPLPAALLLALATLLPADGALVIRPAAAAGCCWLDVENPLIVGRLEVEGIAARPMAVPAEVLRQLGLARARTTHAASILAAADGLALVHHALHGTPETIRFDEPPLPRDVADRLAPLPPWWAPLADGAPQRGEVPADALVVAAGALARAGVRSVEVLVLPDHPTIAAALRPGLEDVFGGSLQLTRSQTLTM
jgi:hypothetical protein